MTPNTDVLQTTAILGRVVGISMRGDVEKKKWNATVLSPIIGITGAHRPDTMSFALFSLTLVSYPRHVVFIGISLLIYRLLP